MNRQDYEHFAAGLDDDAGLAGAINSVAAYTINTGARGQFDAELSPALYRREVVLTNGADLTPEPVIWLWPYWLARGKLHLLAGAPGQGKTTIAMAMAATVSIGGRWPDGSRCEPGNVLIWSGEDDPADTLLPRLIASGADRARCFFVSGTQVAGELLAFNPATDMQGLERQALAIGGVSLLVVDPVVSAVAGDSHKNAEVRRDLQPIVDLASRLGAAAIGITHLSKGGAGGDPATRVIGSIAFTAVARVVLVAAKVKGEEGQDRRILARGKSNIGPDNGGFEYHIETGRAAARHSRELHHMGAGGRWHGARVADRPRRQGRERAQRGPQRCGGNVALRTDGGLLDEFSTCQQTAGRCRVFQKGHLEGDQEAGCDPSQMRIRETVGSPLETAGRWRCTVH